jgi:hypothetical protein
MGDQRGNDETLVCIILGVAAIDDCATTSFLPMVCSIYHSLR